MKSFALWVEYLKAVNSTEGDGPWSQFPKHQDPGEQQKDGISNGLMSKCLRQQKPL